MGNLIVLPDLSCKPDVLQVHRHWQILWTRKRWTEVPSRSEEWLKVGSSPCLPNGKPDSFTWSLLQARRASSASTLTAILWTRKRWTEVPSRSEEWLKVGSSPCLPNGKPDSFTWSLLQARRASSASTLTAILWTRKRWTEVPSRSEEWLKVGSSPCLPNGKPDSFTWSLLQARRASSASTLTAILWTRKRWTEVPSRSEEWLKVGSSPCLPNGKPDPILK